MHEEHNAAPGWYPDPDGQKRYWDGAQWLDLPNPEPQPPQWKTLAHSKVGWITVSCLILALGIGLAMKLSHDANARTEMAAAESATSEAQQREAERIATENADRERREEAERAIRRMSITQVESSIMEMAEGHANSSIIDGPVISVSCSPVSGGSVDDLLALTTVLECFAATEVNPNGSRSGYKYHATMNWEEETYTYGFGAP